MGKYLLELRQSGKKRTYLFLFLLTCFLCVLLLKDKRQAQETMAEEKELNIYSVEDYLDFACSVNEGNTYYMKKVNLCTDLDFAGVEVPMIGAEDNGKICFRGTFDGKGHRIRNLSMESETSAGLFYNLAGFVCNLTVSDARLIAANYAGAIAATAFGDGSIANCRAEAYIEGNSNSGFIGNGGGYIKNCYGFDMTPVAAELNQGIGGLSGSCQIDQWYAWEDTEAGPVMNGNAATTLTGMKTVLSYGGGEREIYAYYSEKEVSWCFAIPYGCTQQQMEIEVDFSSGERLKFSCDISEGSIFEKDSILYPVKFLYTQNCPVLMIDIDAKDAMDYLNEDKENELPGAYSMYAAGGELLSEGLIEGMTSRGNNSWYSVKKGYNLKFATETGLDGMSRTEKYSLLPGYRDNSLITYKLTADLVQQVGMDYAPETRFVQLYFDGVYLGMYFLTQRIEIGETRFDIQNSYLLTEQINSHDLDGYEKLVWNDENSSALRTYFDIPNVPEDVTGGYIFEFDSYDYDPDQSRFVTERGESLVLRSNPYAAKEQIDYIADLWQDFEDALYAEDGYNEKGVYYADYIDLESFADQWLFFELNMEASVDASVYIYKDSDLQGDGLLHAIYPWDNEHGYTTEERYVTRSWFGANFSEDGYWGQLMKFRDFKETAYREWMEKFLPALEAALEPESGLFDQYLTLYRTDGAVNESRWGNCPFEERLEEIRSMVEKRKNFLTRALEIMDDTYAYFREEDGVFYGVTRDGEYISLDEQTEEQDGRAE